MRCRPATLYDRGEGGGAEADRAAGFQEIFTIHNGLERLKKSDQRGAVRVRQALKQRAAPRGLATVKENGFENRPGPSVVKEKTFSSLRIRGEAEAPQGRRPPFGGCRAPFGVAVVQSGSHVVEEKIGVGVDLLVGNRADRRRSRRQRRTVTAGASGLRED